MVPAGVAPTALEFVLIPLPRFRRWERLHRGLTSRRAYGAARRAAKLRRLRISRNQREASFPRTLRRWSFVLIRAKKMACLFDTLRHMITADPLPLTQ